MSKLVHIFANVFITVNWKKLIIHDFKTWNNQQNPSNKIE